MTAHQHWRIYVTEGNAALLCDVGTLEMRATAGGATQCTGGTPSASTAATGSFGPVAGAFDASTSTSWQTTTGSPVGAWLRYSFAAPVTVTQIAITGSSVYYASSPKAVDVQWSDDGSSWTTGFSGSGMTNWTAGSTTLITEGGPVPTRVTAQSLEVLSASAASIRSTAQSLEVLVATYEQRIAKAVGYVVTTSTGDRIGLQKAVGYAVLDDGSLPAIDAYFSNVVLLCHFDGTNGQTTTTDSSPSAHSVLLGSFATLSTTQSKFGGASLATTAGGNTHGIVQAGLTDFQFGSGRFTVEGWVFFTSYSSGGIYPIAGNYSGSSNLGWDFGQVLGQAAFYYSTNGTANASVGGTFTPTLNTWYHFAADRDASNVLRVYVNGAVVASATVASTLYASTANLYLGNDGNLGRGFAGYVDDIRITKGTARYGGAFAVPQAAFPNTGVSSTRRRPVIAICG